MEDKETKETGELTKGRDMTPEELAEFEEAFQEIEESIGLVMAEGEDL